MVLLAIDTSAGTSVALVAPLADTPTSSARAGRDSGVVAVLAQRLSPDTRGHAEVIGTFIRECLDEAGIALTTITGVAVGMGPGPFTGLRVGIAAARAFAWGAGVPVLPVVSHDAVARELFTSDLSDPSPLIVVTDARRKEVYWSTYSGLDSRGLPVRLLGPALARPEELGGALPTLASFRRHDAATVSASSIGILAATIAAAGEEFAGEQALYLRAPDVTVSAGPKRVS
jgi:tRNA threonylcarbamoyl adenosine modification protein YeaZ